MRRPDYSDIPEVFRKAFESEEWNTAGEGEGGEPPTGRPPGPRRTPLWRNRNAWLLTLLLLLFFSFDWLVANYIDWLWFTERGFNQVWVTQVLTRVTAFAIAFVIAATILLLSWQGARRSAARIATPFFSGPAIFNLQPIRLAVTLAALFMAFVFALAAASQWESFLLYLNRVPFGEVDPVFNLEISFYVFELPVYRFLQGWIMPLLLFAAIGVVAIYALRYLPALQGGGITIRDMPIALRRTIAILGALFFAMWAVGYQLDTYELLFSPRGVVFGASYTDLNASLYALYIQLAAAAVLTLTFAYNYFRLELRPIAAAGILWLGATIIVGGIYPAILQRFVVIPNEPEVERPYIRYNIDSTRRAFGLDRIDVRLFGRVDVLSEQDLTDNEAALKNVRLWDYRPLQQTYAQLQELRPYYQFSSIDIDRYDIDGEERQVMLAARELDKAALPSSTWVNQKLIFTHGYGVAMNPVDRFTRQGRPEFFISDLPPTSTVGIEVNRPEVYFGETTRDIVFAGSDQEEFSYADESGDVYSSYEGTGGVPIGGFLNRLLFAYHFGESNLLFSDAVTPQTRAMFYRQIQERINKIVPFLLLDNDPYLTIVDGRLFWIQDAYTVSDNYPYSQPVRLANGLSLNYIRNSVKITLDAYNGEMRFYTIQADRDPLIQVYQRIFPDLFRSIDQMPASIKKHIRYPVDLFRIQTNQYLTYHMTEDQVFYNKEDLWSIPQEIFDGDPQLLEPYYVTFRLPGEAETEFLLIQPYTPAGGKRNMIAWIAARNDPEHYGELVGYEFPRQSLVVGPMQIEGFIDQEPDISQQFTLWDQAGSRIIRGNLIVIPLNDSFLYVEPIYLESSTSALPELKRVIVASGERIVMRTTLDEALSALLQGEGALIEVEIPEEPGLSDAAVAPETSETTPSVAAPDGSIEELIQLANQQFEAAEQAQRNGDWTEYGRQIDRLQATLEQLNTLTSP